ncbi:TPA: hypothetical protein OZR82_004777 [Escherichia coli]|nr:hypothetical protein [Escherichia coli]HCC4829928.1 hypothetical protein [Escherichia coli]HCX4157253.1 hypothetical protein [Escherichia coli]HCX4280038.1 hypothetical protein [Escherichia coli]
MSRRQPELVNGFVPLATEAGQWLYFAPADVKRVDVKRSKSCRWFPAKRQRNAGFSTGYYT